MIDARDPLLHSSFIVIYNDDSLISLCFSSVRSVHAPARHINSPANQMFRALSTPNLRELSPGTLTDARKAWTRTSKTMRQLPASPSKQNPEAPVRTPVFSRPSFNHEQSNPIHQSKPDQARPDRGCRPCFSNLPYQDCSKDTSG